MLVAWWYEKLILDRVLDRDVVYYSYTSYLCQYSVQVSISTLSNKWSYLNSVQTTFALYSYSVPSLSKKYLIRLLSKKRIRCTLSSLCPIPFSAFSPVFNSSLSNSFPSGLYPMSLTLFCLSQKIQKRCMEGATSSIPTWALLHSQPDLGQLS